MLAHVLTSCRVLMLALSVCCAAGGSLTGGSLESTHDSPPPRSPAIDEFEARVGAYLALRRAAATGVPAVDRADDPADIRKHQRALARAIRAARTNAKPGDIFLPAVVPHFRTVVKADLKQRTTGEAAAVREEVPQVPFGVNDVYPEDEPLATVPAMLLASMPRLPDGVEYRFLKRHLILLDAEARLIVDYIPGLFPESGR